MEHNTNHNNKFAGFDQIFHLLLRDLISTANRDDDEVMSNVTKKNCIHLLEEEEPIVINVCTKSPLNFLFIRSKIQF